MFHGREIMTITLKIVMIIQKKLYLKQKKNLGKYTEAIKIDRDSYIQMDRIEQKLDTLQKTLEYVISVIEEPEEGEEIEDATPVKMAVEQRETKMKGKYE